MKYAIPAAWILWGLLVFQANGQIPARLHPDRNVRLNELLDQYHATATYETDVRFNWSPSAAHHAAAVIVKAGSSMGSGTYIEYEGCRFVVTCKHVTDGGGGKATVRFQDGRQLEGTASYDKDGNDLSVVVIPDAGPTPITLAPAEPADGRVEILGFGGPKDILRHWYGSRVRVYDGVADYDCGVAAGDSGGGVLNMQGQLVGVMTHGTTANNPTDGWRTHDKSGGPYWTPIRNFLGRVVSKIRAQQLCPPGGCPPRGGGSLPPWTPPNGGGGGLYPPQEPQPAPPQQIPTPPPPAQPDDTRLKSIELRLSQLESRELIPGPAGPAGKDGRDGKDGKDADPAAIAKIAAQYISIDIDAIAQRIREDQEPIYIGAKDSQGRITMPAAPVRPGDTVYLHIKPPSLSNAGNN